MRNASGRTEWTVRDFFTRPKGWIYIDVMIATVVLLICAGAIMVSYRQMIVEGIFSKSYQQAIVLAQNEMEELLSEEARGIGLTELQSRLAKPKPDNSIDGVSYKLHWDELKEVDGAPDCRQCTVLVTWWDANVKKDITIKISDNVQVTVP